MLRLAARCLLLGSVVLAPSVAAQSATLNRLSGFVSDSVGVPVAFADVRLTLGGNALRELRTDAAGHFVITDLPTGPAQMSVRRIGFHAFSGPITIGDGGADSLRLVLYVATAELAAIEVREESLGDTLAPREFWTRRRSNVFGRYFDRADIEDKWVSLPSEILRGVPGVTLTRSTRMGMLVRIRGCRPNLYVDGMHAAGAEMDELVSVNDIGAMEVYTSLAGVPPQYQERTNPCGAVLFWTRRQ
ncbi:MAG: carboxypeptidase regulatory-like domain-containing protein [Gemmatimonadaceae bacterium]